MQTAAHLALKKTPNLFHQRQNQAFTPSPALSSNGHRYKLTKLNLPDKM